MAKASAQKRAPLTVLLVDDEATHRRVLHLHLSKDYNVLAAEHGQRALELAEQQPIHLLITDLILPGMNGIEVLREIRKRHPDVTAVVITAHPTIQTAVQAMKDGAIDYIVKPFDLDELKAKVDKAAERYRLFLEETKPVRTKPGKLDFSDIVGQSEAMQEVFRLIERVANSQATVLILGESGTGKEMVAKAIHRNSHRANQPFIAVSCGALPETLLENELFGHEKNAYTGADTAQPGRFELADKGTLFLDEIGDISPKIQVSLLRVLQERAFERLGGTKTIKVDVRLIAATNRDLLQLVKESKFREDLYYRLKVVQIYIPPLRERKEDIPLLVEHFVKRFASENERNIRGVTPEAMDLLMQHDWPGNVRELENVILRAIVLADPEAELISAGMLQI